MLMKLQSDVSNFRGLPIDDLGASQTIVSITGETVQLYYYDGGVLTSDDGQAAGTVVVGQLAYGGIKNGLGSMQATNLDTSLSFTSTALTTEVPFPFSQAESVDEASGVDRANAITSGFANGQYCVDYKHGVVYGKKASTTTTLANTAYKIQRNAESTTLVIGANNPQAYGEDAVGDNTYTTIVTANAERHHIFISLGGANDAVVSVDGGATDQFVIPANSVHTFDGVLIANGATVQAKNKTLGQNYTDLRITIW